MSRAAVVGAVNMDICGRPFSPLIMRDSNPGSISLSPGGVGRNIAHDLRLLGVDVTFITAMGEDGYAAEILKSCLTLGFDMSLARTVPGGRTSSYMYITDPGGDMALAVCDTDVSASLSPDFLAGCLDSMNSADAVVVDGNLTDEAIRFVAENCAAPIYADPVSVTKAGRLKPVLSYLTAFKPNEIEATNLTGLHDPADAARALIDEGVGRVFVSLGAGGVIAAYGHELIRVGCEPAEIVNTTGAGDAATSAIIWAGINGLSLEAAARAAMKAGALAIGCQATNNPEMTADRLK